MSIKSVHQNKTRKFFRKSLLFLLIFLLFISGFFRIIQVTAENNGETVQRKEPDDLTGQKWLEENQYFDAENVVNKTDEGEYLELAENNGGYKSSGYRVSLPLSLDAIKKVKSSDIKWTGEGLEKEEGKVDVLVVGGGGAGGARSSSFASGGGGAGGLIFEANYFVSGEISLVVGSGGAGVTNSQGGSGQNSVFGNLIAFGGGGGGHSSLSSGADGGSGGGEGAGSSSGAGFGSGISGQGHDGGNTVAGRTGGGGGGAGEKGQTGTSGNAGDGGAGKDYSAEFGINYGEDGWFAGGGGGNSDSLNGSGGTGGGGSGNRGNGESGLANSGGGGGAGGYSSGTSGSGGSGIVLIRYKTDGSWGIDPNKATGGTKYTEGNYTIHAFTDIGEDIFETGLNSTGVKILTVVSNSGTEQPRGIDVLIVAGGGGGGAAFSNSPRYGGGGGAGGLKFKEGYFLTSESSIPVIVGQGGRGSDNRHSNPHRVAGDDGENSSFGDLVAIGGGGGSGSSSESSGEDPAGDGGSGGGGGGGGFNEGSGGSGTPDQGHDGTDGTLNYSGGGGGAGSAGNETSGGIGQTFWGVTYATGGDGKTGEHAHGANAADNTGDGGEGSSGNGGFGYGGDGGSGIVIVRYKTDGSWGIDPNEATGGNKYTEGDYTFHVFTSDGIFEPGLVNSYQEVINENSIPGISTGNDLTGKYLWVRQELSTEDTEITPRLTSLEISINRETEKLGFEMGSPYWRILKSSINVGGLDYQESERYRLRETIGEVVAGDTASPSYKLRSGYQPMIETYIAAAALPEDITMSPSIGGITGGQSNGTTSIKVTTDSPSGYSLFVRASASPALATSTYSFADYIPDNPEIPDYNWSVPATTAGFGFTPYGPHTADKYRYSGSSCNYNGGLESKDHCWYNLTTSDETIAASYLSNHPEGTETYIRFRAESGSQNIQSSGEYSATLIITVIPN